MSESVNNQVAANAATIVDGDGVVYTLGTVGQVLAQQPFQNLSVPASCDFLVYNTGRVYAHTTTGSWYKWGGNGSPSWTSSSDPR